MSIYMMRFYTGCVHIVWFLWLCTYVTDGFIENAIHYDPCEDNRSADDCGSVSDAACHSDGGKIATCFRGICKCLLAPRCSSDAYCRNIHCVGTLQPYCVGGSCTCHEPKVTCESREDCTSRPCFHTERHSAHCVNGECMCIDAYTQPCVYSSDCPGGYCGNKTFVCLDSRCICM